MSTKNVDVNTKEIADTGTKGNYLTLESPCENKQVARVPLTIRMSNGQILQSTHTVLLREKSLPLKAREAHLFPGLNKALI